MVECPNCGSKALTFGSILRTLLASPPSYTDEQGTLHVPQDPNTSTRQYTCRKCNHRFAVIEH